MYNQSIETTISVHGYRVQLTYSVDENHAIRWDGIGANPLTEVLLRIHEDQHIQKILLDEFKSRQYAFEAQAEAYEDVPF